MSIHPLLIPIIYKSDLQQVDIKKPKAMDQPWAYYTRITNHSSLQNALIDLQPAGCATRNRPWCGASGGWFLAVR